MNEVRAHHIIETLAAAELMEFKNFGAFSGGVAGVFKCGSGTSPWEMHPDGEEFLHALEGSVVIEVLTEGGSQRVALDAGSAMIVPRGHRHRHIVAEHLTEIYVTAGCSKMSDAVDPRVTE